MANIQGILISTLSTERQVIAKAIDNGDGKLLNNEVSLFNAMLLKQNFNNINGGNIFNMSNLSQVDTKDDKELQAAVDFFKNNGEEFTQLETSTAGYNADGNVAMSDIDSFIQAKQMTGIDASKLLLNNFDKIDTDGDGVFSLDDLNKLNVGEDSQFKAAVDFFKNNEEEFLKLETSTAGYDADNVVAITDLESYNQNTGSYNTEINRLQALDQQYEKRINVLKGLYPTAGGTGKRMIQIEYNEIIRYRQQLAAEAQRLAQQYGVQDPIVLGETSSTQENASQATNLTAVYEKKMAQLQALDKWYEERANALNEQYSMEGANITIINIQMDDIVMRREILAKQAKTLTEEYANSTNNS